MRTTIRLPITLLLGSLLLLASLSAPSARAQNRLCFPTVPGITNCIEGRFLDFWQKNGALPVFGYPVTAAQSRTSPEGTFLTQVFERNSFELHPEKAAPYDVLLGRLGVELLARQGRDWKNGPKAAPSDPHYFAETGQAISYEPFWNYWSTHGLQDPALSSFQRSLALFGYPLTAPLTETNPAGDTVMTQWFERARFEYHPNEPDPFKVLLGLVGSEWLSTTPPPDQLTNTSWVLTMLNGQLPLAGSTITLTFGGDGTVSGSDGCNSFSAGYTVSGSNLIIKGPIVSTQRACDESIMRQATVYQAALTQTASYSVEGQQLTLRDATGKTLATFVSQPTGLANTSWTVVTYNNGTGGVVSVLTGSELTASFTASQIAGFAGCNDYSGTYQSDGHSTFTVGPLATARKFCPEPAGLMDQEARYLAALGTAASYTVSGNTLELRTASGALAVSFQRR